MLPRIAWSLAAVLLLGVTGLAAPRAQVQRGSIELESSRLTRIDAWVSPWANDGRAVTLFVALHGFGSGADDFASVGADLAAMGTVAVLPEGPYAFDIGDGAFGHSWTLRGTGDAWELEASRLRLIDEDLPALVAHLTARFDVVETYLLGFSQGGRMALATALRHPDLFNGVVTFGMSGFDPEWVSGAGPTAAARLPVWLGHGNAESQGIQSANARAVEQLEAAGFRVASHVFEGGHEIPLPALREAVIWMLRSSRRLR